MDERDYKLDILKAFAIVLVLIWHLQPLRISSVDSLFIPLSNKAVELIYQKTLVAVPIFYFVSLFIFFQKNNVSGSYVKYRLQRIFSIFIFWSFIQIIVYLIVEESSHILHLPFEETVSSSKLWWYILMGGPSLPVVGDSVFYFLSNLMLLTILSFFYGKYSSKHFDVLMLVVLSFYIMIHQFFFTIPYWRIDNFLIYIPLSHLMANKYYQNMVSWKFLYISLCLYITFSMLEIAGHKFLYTRHGAYDINSLHWGVISLFIIIQLIPSKRIKGITWLSQYSLGLFALHKYYFLFFLFIFQGVISEVVLIVGGSIIKMMYVPIFVFTIMFTYLTIQLLNKNKILKKFIT